MAKKQVKTKRKVVKRKPVKLPETLAQSINSLETSPIVQYNQVKPFLQKYNHVEPVLTRDEVFIIVVLFSTITLGILLLSAINKGLLNV